MTALPAPRLRHGWQPPLALVRPQPEPQYWAPRRLPSWRPRHSELQVEDLGHIIVARFTCRSILSGHTADVLGKQLSSLVRPGGHRRIVINFAGVRRLTTAMMTKLLILHVQLRTAGGSMVLCNVAPHLMEIFNLLRLKRLFGIFEAEPEAMQTFHLGDCAA
jgi:anti-anti-sigma regulatory factor